MAKYIQKQAAIYALVNEANTHNNPVKRAYTRAAAIIEQITSEDVQPVQHGRWIAENRDNRGYADCYTCTNCNCYSYTYTLMKDCEYEYCPNCGARMDGGADDENEQRLHPHNAMLLCRKLHSG